jgi:hypothetical protein
MTISSVEVKKQRYSRELAEYTTKQWTKACRSADEQKLPTSNVENAARRGDSCKAERAGDYP